MINTILFDLDGTLLRFKQEDFINTYFKRLGKVFDRLGMKADKAIEGVWIGTKAMMKNDGTCLNIERFWEAFAAYMHLDNDQMKLVEKNCDAFYSGDFDNVKSIIEPTEIPARLVNALRIKGFTVALATNPLFPACAVTTRLRWIGMLPEDFAHITNYSNSTFCKPNPGYFHELLGVLGKKPRECIMVGNSAVEDMSAHAIGIDTYLVTDYLENETGADISVYKHGTLEQLEEYLMSLPV